jgi:hypothetical protein
MDRYQVNYSALGMSDENSISPGNLKVGRNVNFLSNTSDGTSPAAVEAARQGNKFFQRPRSLSVWSTSSVMSRTSNRYDER